MNRTGKKEERWDRKKQFSISGFVEWRDSIGDSLVGGGFFCQVNVTLFVVDFLSFFVAHQQDGSTKEENCCSPSHTVSLRSNDTRNHIKPYWAKRTRQIKGYATLTQPNSQMDLLPCGNSRAKETGYKTRATSEDTTARNSTTMLHVLRPPVQRRDILTFNRIYFR